MSGKSDEVERSCGDECDSEGMYHLGVLAHAFQKTDQYKGEWDVFYEVAVGSYGSFEHMVAPIA